MCSAQTHKHIHTDHRDICSNRLHLLIALIVSRISDALSALGGFLTGQQINRTDVFFCKVRRFGLCSSKCVSDVSECISLADSKLFKSIQSPSHCLSHILSSEKNLSGLRSRGHGYVLPICQYSFCKKIISRCLFHFFCNC